MCGEEVFAGWGHLKGDIAANTAIKKEVEQKVGKETIYIYLAHIVG